MDPIIELNASATHPPMTAKEYLHALIDQQRRKVLSLHEQIKDMEKKSYALHGAKAEAQQHLEQLVLHQNALAQGQDLPGLPLVENKN